MIQLTQIQVPDFGMEGNYPDAPASVYNRRLQAAVERMKARGLDFLVIYGDREHFANIHYLTGFDPRFEEALLLLDRQGTPTLLVGNECMGYLPKGIAGLRPRLYQELSLLGQDRSQSPSLRSILAEAGIAPGRALGCVGWKYFDPQRVEGGASALDVPSYLADLLRDMAGPGKVVNATDLFMGLDQGLRLTHEAHSIAQLEYAAIRTSQSVAAVIEHLRPGISERELSRFIQADGLPLSCHVAISTGDKARCGLAGPSDAQVRRGDAFTCALGLWGALTARAGYVAQGPEDLPAEARDFYPSFAANYFDVVAAWYQSVRVGATGGDVFAAVHARRDKALFDLALNPGHYIAMDEWVHSPFAAGSSVVLHSGAALQADLIPVSKGPFCTSNAEDGIALADEALREQLQRQFPVCWKRIERRRTFLREALNIEVDPSLLPLSNRPAVLAPYLLRPTLVFKRV